MDTACYGHKDNGCGVLVMGDCSGCAFRKTTRERQAGTARAYARLRGLPKSSQDYISDKYYRGKKPWAK